jgi:cytochrome c peroxidase
LFYDKNLSVNNSVSCASCHKQELAFGDNVTACIGVNGVTGRHSMRLVNTRFSNESRFFWDERANTLETQTTMPIQDHI